MNPQQPRFQDLLSRQIKIRDLQGRWRRVSMLSENEIEQLWNETTEELGHQKIDPIKSKVGPNSNI